VGWEFSKKTKANKQTKYCVPIGKAGIKDIINVIIIITEIIKR
jgi:hypothetical protein